MGKRKTDLLMMIGITVVILLTVFLLIGYTSIHRGQPQIVLPEESSASDLSTPGEEDGENRAVARVEVSPETVQAVIATLKRPEAYLRTITVTTYWSGGSGSASVDVSVSGDTIRMDTTLPGGQIRHTLRAGTETYLWYNSERSVSRLPTGDFSADGEQWIPTYEDILALDQKRIAKADYETYQDLNCIRVETATDEAGYVDRYWISVESGLLVAAERLQYEHTVYQMESLSVTVGEPPDSVFTLPDGTLLHTSGI